MNDSIIITSIICTSIVAVTVIIYVFKYCMCRTAKAIEKEILFDERNRKDKWEKEILNRNETTRKEKETKEEENTIKNLKSENEELRKEIEMLKQDKSLEYILISKLGDISKEKIKEEKQRIISILEEIRIK